MKNLALCQAKHDPSVVKHSNTTNESIDQSASFLWGIGAIEHRGRFFVVPSCTLIAAPSGTRHSARSCVAALEKGTTISGELRLAVNQMASSHSRRLNVSLHQERNLT